MGIVIFILFYICFTVICFNEGWYILGTILSLIPIFAVIALVISSQKEKVEREERQKRSQELKAKKEEELKTIIIPAYNKSRTELINRYGNPTKVFVLEQYNLNKEIIAFEESKRIWICGSDFPMKSILSCTFTDDKNVVKGQITSTTTTNSGNMVKRAVVGDVLLGPAGAIIGGSTASKATITTQENDKVVHDYTVILNVDSLSEPIIRVHIGSDVDTVNEIVGLMNVIISRR
jgi:hypothetical protein